MKIGKIVGMETYTMSNLAMLIIEDDGREMAFPVDVRITLNSLEAMFGIDEDTPVCIVGKPIGYENTEEGLILYKVDEDEEYEDSDEEHTDSYEEND